MSVMGLLYDCDTFWATNLFNEYDCITLPLESIINSATLLYVDSSVLQVVSKCRNVLFVFQENRP